MTHISETLQEKFTRRIPGAVEKPSRDRDASPDCTMCGGWGYRQSAKYNNHWLSCECVTDNRQIYLDGKKPKIDYAQFGIGENELDMDWSLVKPGISDGMKGMNAVRSAYIIGHGFIFLHGAYGQAKTLIGKILTATAMRDGKKAAYANVSTVLDNIRLAFDEQEHKTTELLRRIDWWINRDVLFLDELDKNKDTEWAHQRMFELLDQRYMRAIREEALTVIASNGGDKELDGYLRSRLNDSRLGPVVFMNGNDGRSVMPKGYKF